MPFTPASRAALVAALLSGLALDARADSVTDWDLRTTQIIVEAKLGTPPAVRVTALVQTAAYEAARALPADASAASIDAAIAAAHRVTLSKLLPAQQAQIEAAYQAALASIPDSAARAAAVAAGERTAASVLEQRAVDSIAAADTYRPLTTAGGYVPTAVPAALPWRQRTAWAMTSPAQFRAPPPPTLTSEAWTRDFNEVKDVGARSSTQRTGEQTEIARFWEYSLPSIYLGVVRSVAQQPGRDVVRNARLYAAAAQAMDDALIAVFEAKYHYNFWRPVTAIRNGDIDGNEATQRDAGWASLIDAPLHPEYPSGHSTLAGAVAAVLKVEAGSDRIALSTSSPSAKGATRRWTSISEFVREVSEARIWAGIHFRSATEAGTSMGTRVGELVARRVLAPANVAGNELEVTLR